MFLVQWVYEQREEYMKEQRERALYLIIFDPIFDQL